MEDGAVEEFGVDVGQEVLDREGGLVGIELDRDVALAGFDKDRGRSPGGRRRSEDGQQQTGQGYQGDEMTANHGASFAETPLVFEPA